MQGRSPVKTLSMGQRSTLWMTNLIYQESVNIRQQECLSAVPNKAVIQGMLAGLRGLQPKKVTIPRNAL